MTKGALAVSTEQSEWRPDQLEALSLIGLKTATNTDLQMLLNYAQRTGLDPFARQIYMVGRFDKKAQKTKYSIQASIDGLRVVASRSKEYAGQVGPEWAGPDGVWLTVWLATERPAAARVGVKRKGFDGPVWGVALWSEFAARSPLWMSMPTLMLAKCAEALALRKAFPNDLSGIYTSEEMDQAGGPSTVLTLDEVQVSLEMAVSEDELRNVWTAAKDAGVLGAEVKVSWSEDKIPVRDAIDQARNRIVGGTEDDK